MGAQDCGCGPGPTEELLGGTKSSIRVPIGRLEKPARIDVHWNLYAGEDARAIISITAVGGSVRDARYAVDTGDHLLTYQFDRSKSLRSWTVDEHESGLVEGGFGLLRRRGSIQKVSAYAAKADIPPTLKKLATTYPFPPLLAIISSLGLALEPTLIDDVDNVVRDLLRNEKIARTINLGSGSTGCSESGYCSPEFSSCTECSGDSGIFGDYESWPPGGGGGAGGGGGSEDDERTRQCNEQFLRELRDCNYKKMRCDLARPDLTTNTSFSDSRFASFLSAADYDICDEEFDACRAYTVLRHKLCLAGLGLPL